MKPLKSIHFLALAMLGLFAPNVSSEEAKLGIPIAALPAVINSPGVYVLQSDFEINLPSGAALTIAADNVVIDFNGRTISNTQAGAATGAYGVYSLDRANVTVRNGRIKGFNVGVFLNGSDNLSCGNLVEEMHVDRATSCGIYLFGAHSMVRRCEVSKIGGASLATNKFNAGIAVSGVGARILDNDVSEVGPPAAGSFPAVGLYLRDGDGFAVGNRASQVHTGLYMASRASKFRNNLIPAAVTVPVDGGVDAGSTAGIPGGPRRPPPPPVTNDPAPPSAPPANYEAWILDHFTASERADQNTSGREADPDNDGRNNFEEFVNGTAPKEWNAPPTVNYYVAAEDGNDNWDGLAPSWDGMHGPWSTLNKASTRVYDAGSAINLKRGKVWLQTLTLTGQGTISSRNFVRAYGSGVNPQIRGISNEPGGSMGIRTSTPDYWTIENIDFNQLWRGIEIVLYTTGHQSVEIRNCNFWSNNAYVLRTDPGEGVWPQPAATGIAIEGSGVPDSGIGANSGDDILTGVIINNCRFTKMGQSIGIGNIGHNGNEGVVRDTVISNCVMENGSFIQLGAVGAHTFKVLNTKIWNNGVNIWNGPTSIAFYKGHNKGPANLLIEDCEIGFTYVCDSPTECSPSDGEGIEINGASIESGTDSAIFHRVLFHHNDATAVLINTPSSGFQFENCVFAADEAYDVNGAQGCEPYGEFRLHAQLGATFSGCRFLPRSSLPWIPHRQFAVPQVPDIPQVGTCVQTWHSGITFSNTTTSEYGKEFLGANLAVGASSYQYAGLWGYWFSTSHTINTVVLTEPPGGGISKFVVQYLDAATNTWKDAYTGKGIGTSIYDRYLPFPAISTTAIRVQQLDGDAWWSGGLIGFEVYNANGTNPTDQFLSTTLNEDWSWVPRPAGPAWNLFDHLGFLRMATDGQDLWESPGGAPSTILLRPIPPGDWTATTRLEFSPAVDYQQAGIILYSDDDNYIKLAYGHESQQPAGTAVDFVSESGGAPLQRPKVNVNNSAIYLRLVKSGSTYRGYWSVDGTNWETWPGVWEFHDINLNSPRIGLIAQGVAGALPDFDWFDIR